MNQSDKKRLNEVKAIMQKLIDYYRPAILVIEKPKRHWNKQSNLLNKVCEVIMGTAKANGLKVKEFTPEQIRKTICGDAKANKEEMVKILLLKYPDLLNVLCLKKIKNRYGRYVLGAIALSANMK